MFNVIELYVELSIFRLDDDTYEVIVNVPRAIVLIVELFYHIKNLAKEREGEEVIEILFAACNERLSDMERLQLSDSKVAYPPISHVLSVQHSRLFLVRELSPVRNVSLTGKYRVVGDNQLPLNAHLHIEFEEIGTNIGSRSEGFQRVLRE